jgi:hypothetical protein
VINEKNEPPHADRKEESLVGDAGLEPATFCV